MVKGLDLRVLVPGMNVAREVRNLKKVFQETEPCTPERYYRFSEGLMGLSATLFYTMIVASSLIQIGEAVYEVTR